MIGRLRGTLLNKQPPTLLIEVGGVGYDVEAPLSTFAVLPAVNQEAILHTHLAVREDAQVLYGFATLGERDLFRDLIKVSGIGAKLALTILSGASGQELAQFVADGAAAAGRVARPHAGRPRRWPRGRRHGAPAEPRERRPRGADLARLQARRRRAPAA